MIKKTLRPVGLEMNIDDILHIILHIKNDSNLHVIGIADAVFYSIKLYLPVTHLMVPVLVAGVHILVFYSVVALQNVDIYVYNITLSVYNIHLMVPFLLVAVVATQNLLLFTSNFKIIKNKFYSGCKNILCNMYVNNLTKNLYYTFD